MRATLVLLLIMGAGLTRAQESDTLEMELPDSLYEYTTLEEALKNPKAVLYLDLSKQKRSVIPPEVFTFTNLVSLKMSKNKIKEIPVEIASLKKLEELDLSRNKIEIIPVAVFELTKLKKLVINQNLIVSIPSEIRKLQKLEYLDMWSNELEYFPEELSQLKNLKEFDLRNIQILPAEQQRISKLLPTTKIHFSQSCNCGN